MKVHPQKRAKHCPPNRKRAQSKKRKNTSRSRLAKHPLANHPQLCTGQRGAEIFCGRNLLQRKSKVIRTTNRIPAMKKEATRPGRKVRDKQRQRPRQRQRQRFQQQRQLMRRFLKQNQRGLHPRKNPEKNPKKPWSRPAILYCCCGGCCHV